MLLGGPKDDDLFGDNGRDDLYGNQGSDDLNGGNGNDFCKGGPGNDIITDCEGASAASLVDETVESLRGLSILLNMPGRVRWPKQIPEGVGE